MSVAVVMPTVPRRATSASATIKALLHQCTRFYAHLDGYESIPPWMPSEVRCFVQPKRRGPGVRFSVVPDEDYVLFVDDDLRHPPDYVERSVAALTRLGPKHAIAYHAAWWPDGSPPRYRHRVLASYWSASKTDQAVTYVGSGTLGLRTSDLRVVDRVVPEHLALEDDVWISGALARAGIRCARPATSSNWIAATAAGNDGLYTEAAKDGFRRRDDAIAEVLAMGKWKLTR